MTDHELALSYAPIIHFDKNETIPLRAVGYTVARSSCASLSFPKRNLLISDDVAFIIEYAYYWDYDIQHMYDLEHIWVNVDKSGRVQSAEGSFHGGFLPLFFSGVSQLTDNHIHAYCQPGKHAFLGSGELFRAMPFFNDTCNKKAGGDILIGGPFNGKYAPTDEENALCRRYICEHLTFEPTLEFTKDAPEGVLYMSWEALCEKIPQWIIAECARLTALYKGE